MSSPQDKGHRAVALCFAALMLAGAGLGLREAGQAGLGPFSTGEWLDGTATSRWNAAFALPGQKRLESLDAAWRYRVLGQLGSQVQQGCPGWLFYTDGLRAPVADPQAVVAQRIALMQRLAAQLRASGVQLLAVTVPDKSHAVGEALCGLQRPAATAARWDQWQQALQQAGVAHVDLMPALRAAAPAYYRTDVHMTQEGAAAAAQALAAAALPLLGGKGPVAYDLERAAAPEPRVGDLLTLAGLEQAPDGWRPPPDSYRPETLRQQAEGGLLDEGPPATVLLAGSSNARRSNFAEQLGMALGQPIWNQSRDGGKFADALMQAMAQRQSWPASLKLVVWEMSEMSLTQPLTADEREALSRPALP